MQELIDDAGLGEHVTVLTFDSKLKPSTLQRYEHLLIDSGMKIPSPLGGSKLFKRCRFPFPIKLTENGKSLTGSEVTR